MKLIGVLPGCWCRYLVRLINFRCKRGSASLRSPAVITVITLSTLFSGCGTSYYYYEVNQTPERAVQAAMKTEVYRYFSDSVDWRVNHRFLAYEREHLDAQLAVNLDLSLGTSAGSPGPMRSIVNLQVKVEPDGEWVVPVLIYDTVWQDTYGYLWGGWVRSSIFGPIPTKGKIPKQVHLMMDLVTTDSTGEETGRRLLEMTADRKRHTMLEDFLDGR